MGATKYRMGSPNHAVIMQCSSRCTCTLYYLSAGKFQMSNVVPDFLRYMLFLVKGGDHLGYLFKCR